MEQILPDERTVINDPVERERSIDQTVHGLYTVEHSKIRRHSNCMVFVSDRNNGCENIM